MNREKSLVIDKGEVYWFDPLKETKVDISPLAIVFSSRLHNSFSDQLIICLISKNAEKVKEAIEIKCQLGKRNFKLLIIKDFLEKTSVYFITSYLDREKKEIEQNNMAICAL